MESIYLAGWAAAIGDTEKAEAVRQEACLDKATSTYHKIRSQQGVTDAIGCLDMAFHYMMNTAEKDTTINLASIDSVIVAAEDLSKCLPESVYHIALHQVLLLAMANDLRHAISAMTFCGTTSVEQIDHVLGEQTLAVMVVAKVDFDSLVSQGIAKWKDHEVESRSWEVLSDKLKPLKTEAVAIEAAFKTALCQDFSLKITNCIDELEVVKGGLLAGGSWKDGLEPTASWDAVVDKASSGLMKQRGLKTKMENAMQDLHESMFQAASHKVAGYTISKELDSLAKEVLATAQVTLLEAFVIQMSKAVATPTAALRIKIEAESTRLADAKICTSRLHPAIWARIQSILGSE